MTKIPTSPQTSEQELLHGVWISLYPMREAINRIGKAGDEYISKLDEPDSGNVSAEQVEILRLLTKQAEGLKGLMLIHDALYEHTKKYAPQEGDKASLN